MHNIKKRFLFISLVAIVAVLGSYFMSAPTVKADNNQYGASLSMGVSVSGSTVTVSGNYQAGATTILTVCAGGHAIDVPLPEGGATSAFNYSTDTGKGDTVDYTVTKSATTQNCAGFGGQGNPNLGNPEEGTYSFSFKDNLTSRHVVTVTYVDNLGDDLIATSTYGVATPAPTVSLTASPSTITLGSSTLLTIVTTNATACVASGTNDGTTWKNAVPTSGTKSETPNATGTAAFDITCTGPGGSASDSANVTVNAPVSAPVAVGTIVVTSENADNTSTLVNATWALNGNVAGTDVCEYLNVPCTGTKRTYPGLPVLNSSNGKPNLYQIPLKSLSTGVYDYSFQSIEATPIAVNNGGSFLVSLRLAVDSVFSTVAQAVTISQGTSQQISSSTPTGFTILWTPDAVMQVTPGSFTTTWTGANTDTAKVTNIGAPYSTLTWTASAKTTSGGNWLVAPAGDPAPGITNGSSGSAPENATISFNSAVVKTLPTGSYTGQVIFTGYNGVSKLPTQTVSVTLKVTAVVPPPVLTASCSPSSIDTSQTSQCTLFVNGVKQLGGVTWAMAGPASTGSINASGVYTPSSSTGPENVKGTLSSGSSAQATIIVTPGPDGFACSAGSCMASALGTGTSCSNACGVPASSLSASCSPSTIDLTQTSDCTLSLGGTTQSNVTWAVIAGPGSIDPSSGIYSPTTTGTAMISGTLPDGTSADASVVVTSIPGGYACGAGSCVASSTGAGTSCSNACGAVVSSLTATCAPGSIDLSQTSDCTLSLGGTTQSSVTWALLAGPGSIDSSSGIYSPTATGTAMVTGTLPDGTSADATISVTGLPVCAPSDASCQPVCSPELTANPTNVVVPETSQLTYSCTPVTSCTLSATDPNFATITLFPPGSSNTITGSSTVDPEATTVYTLDCTNGGFAGATTQSTVQVSVGGLGRCEQNPNGAGCPQPQ